MDCGAMVAASFVVEHLTVMDILSLTFTLLLLLFAGLLVALLDVAVFVLARGLEEDDEDKGFNCDNDEIELRIFVLC